MRNRFRALAWLVLALLAPLLLAAARPALTVHEAVLHSDPAADAAAVATLPPETALTVLERLGGWYRVETEAGAGWLRLASLRFPSETQREAESGVDTLLGMMRVGAGPAGASSGTTTGVRGLDANAITSASPDEKALEKLEAQASTADAGRALAAAAKLVASEIAYLEPVAPPEAVARPRPKAASSSGGKAKESCYGDGCDRDLPFLGGG
jgi:hypothetical protein